MHYSAAPPSFRDHALDLHVILIFSNQAIPVTIHVPMLAFSWLVSYHNLSFSLRILICDLLRDFAFWCFPTHCWNEKSSLLSAHLHAISTCIQYSWRMNSTTLYLLIRSDVRFFRKMRFWWAQVHLQWLDFFSARAIDWRRAFRIKRWGSINPRE